MAIRINCTADGFEGNWLELDMDRWSVRETMEHERADVAGMIALLRRRVTACHIELNTGEILTGPNDFTEDSLMDADEIVLGWLGGAFARAIGRRRALGNMSARPLSNTSGMDALTPA